MEKIRPMARPVNDELHRVHLAADVHRRAAGQLAREALHDAVDVAGDAAEVAVLRSWRRCR